MNTNKLGDLKKFIPVGAFGLSMFVHVGLILFIGGAVIIEGIVPKPKFLEYVATEDNLNLEVPPLDEAIPEDPNMEPANLSEPLPESVTSPMPDMDTQDVIQLNTPSIAPTFTLPSPVANVTGLAAPDAEAKPVNRSSNTTRAAIRSMASLFGSKGEESDALVGYMYDMKQTADGKENDMVDDGKDEKAKSDKYKSVMSEFAKDWNPGTFSKFYKTRDPLSAYQIFIPGMLANLAPKAFDVEKQVKPKRWAIHYKGNFVAPRTTTFRFVGVADDHLMVRFNRENVLDAGLHQLNKAAPREVTTESAGIVAYATRVLYKGAWIKVREGQSYPMEVAVGEMPGGYFVAFLLVEEKGVEYQKRLDKPSPRYAVFQMAPTKMPKYEEEKIGPSVAAEAFSGIPE